MNMPQFIRALAYLSAIVGGLVLTGLALIMSISIIGGSIAKLAYSDWLMAIAPDMAAFLQQTGIRTIKGMYEVISITMAFVIFSFLPITQLKHGHAVVDIFTNYLSKRPQQAVIAFWEIIFFLALGVITWRLWYGMQRMASSGIIYADLNIPQWWGYALGFGQMCLVTVVAGFCAYSQLKKAMGASSL